VTMGKTRRKFDKERGSENRSPKKEKQPRQERRELKEKLKEYTR
jgi:hypothetical protein